MTFFCACCVVTGAGRKKGGASREVNKTVRHEKNARTRRAVASRSKPTAERKTLKRAESSNSLGSDARENNAQYPLRHVDTQSDFRQSTRHPTFVRAESEYHKRRYQ